MCFGFVCVIFNLGLLPLLVKACVYGNCNRRGICLAFNSLNKPKVGHVTCTEDAAAYVPLTTAVDLSVDACRLFSMLAWWALTMAATVMTMNRDWGFEENNMWHVLDLMDGLDLLNCKHSMKYEQWRSRTFNGRNPNSPFFFIFGQNFILDLNVWLKFYLNPWYFLILFWSLIFVIQISIKNVKKQCFTSFSVGDPPTPPTSISRYVTRNPCIWKTKAAVQCFWIDGLTALGWNCHYLSKICLLTWNSKISLKRGTNMMVHSFYGSLHSFNKISHKMQNGLAIQTTWLDLRSQIIVSSNNENKTFPSRYYGP